MSRILIGSLLVLALLAGGVSLVWHLAYGVQDGPDPSEVVDLRSTHLYEDLGRAHATHRTWISLLLRQAALGRLGTWFGPSATAEDIRVVELGFAVSARAAFQALPEAEQDRFAAYARGMNAGLAAADASLAAPLVILDAEPARWEAWHALAVERLVLWLYASHPEGTADYLLQQRLAWSGGLWNHVWMSEDGAAGARLLTGTSAVPVFQEAYIRRPDGAWLGSLLTIPGTIMAPMGARPELAWAFTLRSGIERLPAGTGVTVEHDRVTIGLDEVLVERRRRPDDAIRMPGPNADLRWAGLGAATDASQWMALLDGRAGGPWMLHTGDGLVREAGQPVRISGRPETVVQASGRTLVSNAPPESSAERAFVESTDPTSTHSPFAQDRVQAFLATIPDSVSLGAASTQALTYLRNWNVTFDATEIGATLFDALEIQPDSTPSQPLTRLNQAMDRLTLRMGPDPSRWRWADAHPQRLAFPGWTPAPSDPDPEPEPRTVRIFRDRYAPVTVHGGGHPTSLVWHATPGAPATSAWEGAVGARGALAFRRPDIRFDAFLGRSMRLDHPIDAITAVP